MYLFFLFEGISKSILFNFILNFAISSVFNVRNVIIWHWLGAGDSDQFITSEKFAPPPCHPPQYEPCPPPLFQNLPKPMYAVSDWRQRPVIMETCWWKLLHALKDPCCYRWPDYGHYVALNLAALYNSHRHDDAMQFLFSLAKACVYIFVMAC